VSADLIRFSRRKIGPHALEALHQKRVARLRGKRDDTRAKLANTERALRLINQDKALIVADFHKFWSRETAVFMGIRKILRIV
jgi:hypothetical protein